MTLNTQWKWRDGLAVVSYDSKLRMMGGWNDDAAFPNPSTNQEWTSSNEGLTWTQLSDASWSRRHSFGFGVKDSKVFIWGSDLSLGSPQKDVWTYDLVNGWVSLTSDWGVVGGSRILFAHCIHNNSLFMAGGQLDAAFPSTYYTDILKYNETTNQWVKTGDLPVSYFSTGCMVSDGSKIWIYAGGQYDGANGANLNTNLYYSSDEGATWTLHSALPAMMNGIMYAFGIYFDGCIWFLNGYGDGGNQSGLFVFQNNTWVKVADNDSTHASVLCEHNNALFIVSGNVRNSVFKISQV